MKLQLLIKQKVMLFRITLVSITILQRSSITSLSTMPSYSTKATTTTMQSPSFSLASKLNVTDDIRHSHRPAVIGHRGSLYTALENTSRSFIDAAKAGADGIELDVFLLRCGTVVVFHGTGTDQSPGLLQSYCGIEGSILDYTADEAKSQLRFNKHSDQFGCGPEMITDDNHDDHYCYVHTLEEVLLTLRDHPDVKPEFLIKIELKGPGTALPSVELVKKHNMMHRCQFASFNHERIAEVKSIAPDATTGALWSDLPDDFLERCIQVQADEVHFRYDTCTHNNVEAAHKAGMSTMAWFRGPKAMGTDAIKYHDVGNEDVNMYRTVLQSGVMSLCANRPAIALEAVLNQVARCISDDESEE